MGLQFGLRICELDRPRPRPSSSIRNQDVHAIYKNDLKKDNPGVIRQDKKAIVLQAIQDNRFSYLGTFFKLEKRMAIPMRGKICTGNLKIAVPELFY